MSKGLDRSRLEAGFYLAFDRTLVETVVSKDRDALEKIGHGVDFEVFLLTRGVSPLVVKIADNDDLIPDSIRRRNLVEALRVVGAKKFSLWPPMEVFEVGDDLVIVQPYASESLDKASDSWLPIDGCLNELDDNLKSAGYRIEDKQQGGCLDGIPFVYDVSDLVKI
jgi:hypothetical protein